MSEIIEARELPESEKVYLKKDFLGWRVVEPWRNPETGKINFPNLLWGGKKGAVSLLIVLLLLSSLFLAYREQISNYQKVMKNPCDYCTNCQEHVRSVISEYQNTSKQKYAFPMINITK